MRSNSDNAILNMLYRGTTTVQDFYWDSMTTVPLLSLMTTDDINYIKNLILSPRYSGNNKLKMEKIDEVMHARGFTRFAGGTNRLVYTNPAAPNAVFKVAIDSVGINDNPAEYYNQRFLKPYCCKVFECSPCGTIASFEKVERITTFEEFYSIADDYFYLITRVILGKYVMEDIGIDYFMNIAIRKGFGIVLIDFPYLFELDGRKLECGNILDDGSVCGGEIDYDKGFNKLICRKCNRIHRARDLAKPPENSGILLRQKGGRRMKLSIMKGDKVIKTYDTTIERDYLSKNDKEVTNGKYSVNVHIERKRIDEPVIHDVVNEKVKDTVICNDNEQKITDNNTTVIPKVITVSLENNKPVEKKVETSIPVTINRRKIEVPVARNKKPSVVVAEDVKTTPKDEVVTLKEPIAERIINVSVNKQSSSKQVIKADQSVNSSIKVIINKNNTDTSEEKPVSENIVKAEEMEENKSTNINPDEVKSADNMISEDNNEERELVQAISFWDNVEDEDVVEESTIDEHKEMEESPIIETDELTHEEESTNDLNDDIADTTEVEEVQNEDPKISDDIESYTDEMINTWLADLNEKELTPELINDEIEEMYGTIANEIIWEKSDSTPNIHTENIKVLAKYLDILNEMGKPKEVKQYSTEVDEVEEIHEEVIEEVAAEETTQEELVEEQDTAEVEEIHEEVIEEVAAEETTQEECTEVEEKFCDVYFVDEIPSPQKAKYDSYYCIKVSPEADQSKYDQLNDLTDIDESLFHIYYKIDDDHVVRISYNSNINEWEYEDPNEYEEEDILSKYEDSSYEDTDYEELEAYVDKIFGSKNKSSKKIDLNDLK